MKKKPSANSANPHKVHIRCPPMVHLQHSILIWIYESPGNPFGITSSNPPAKEPSAFLHEWFSPSAPQKSRFKKCKEIDMWLKKTLLDSNFVAVSLGAGSARKIGCHDSYPSETIKYIPHNAWRRMEWPPSQLHCMAPPCQKASPLHWPGQRWRRACKSGMFSQLKSRYAVLNWTYVVICRD